MRVFLFEYRDKTTGELVEVRTRADNEKKALKAFSLKAPTVDIGQIETLNGAPFVNTTGKVGLPSGQTASQKVQSMAEQASTAHSSHAGKPENFVLGVLGITCMAIGLYLLLISPGTDTAIGDVVNLQKLSIGQTLSIFGAIFIAVQWRPR
ncbi:hypothetical protein [Halomonas sp. 25-S5]|uniref:hypothetical protein n=1 Tax=Halomonas sp. 25-S5 TaxID=2994065 RepID=UPI0024696427|nr:hypothetical protein [Halomonas sp. 25-S5]